MKAELNNKKIISFVLALVLMCSLVPCIGVSAAASYTAVVSAPDTCAPGSIVEVTVSARSIKDAKGFLTDGLLTTTFILKYDSSLFIREKAVPSIPSTWEYFDNIQTDGEWTAFTSWDSGDVIGITKDDVILIKFQFKVADISKDTDATFEVIGVQGSNGGIELFEGIGSSAKIRITKEKPTTTKQPETTASPTTTTTKKSETTIPTTTPTEPKITDLIIDDKSPATVETDNRIYGATPKSDLNRFLSNFKNQTNTLLVKDSKGEEIKEDSGYVSTGAKITLLCDGKEVMTFSVVIDGDIDCDGEITQNDYSAAKLHLKGQSVLSGDALAASDVDRNGFISSADYLRIKHLLVS